MRFERLVRVLVLLAFLAGPFGCLALDHAEFHCDQCPGDNPPSGDTAPSGVTAPCPICHAAGTPGVSAPGPAAIAQPLPFEGLLAAPPAFCLVSEAGAASLVPRAPPVLS